MNENPLYEIPAFVGMTGEENLFLGNLWGLAEGSEQFYGKKYNTKMNFSLHSRGWIVYIL